MLSPRFVPNAAAARARAAVRTGPTLAARLPGAPVGPAAPPALPGAAPLLRSSFARRVHDLARSAAAEQAGRHVHLSNLPFCWTFLELQDVFRPFGQVTNIQVARRASDGLPLGCAVVTFENEADARAAAKQTDGQRLGSRKLRAGVSREDMGAVPASNANLETVVCVSDLAPECTPTELCSFYSGYGRVVDTCILFSRTGSKWNANGFLQFATRENADIARKEISTTINNVGPERRAATDSSGDEVLTGDRDVYVSNLSLGTTPSAIGSFFLKFGDVTCLSFPRFTASGQPRGDAFLSFRTVHEAQWAAERANGAEVDGQKISACCGNNALLPSSGNASSVGALSVVEVRNLAKHVKKEAVMEVFQQFGPVVKVFIAPGVLGSSYVWFKTPDAAERAVDQSKNLRISGCPVLLQLNVGGLPRLRLGLSKSPTSPPRHVYSRRTLLSA